MAARSLGFQLPFADRFRVLQVTPERFLYCYFLLLSWSEGSRERRRVLAATWYPLFRPFVPHQADPRGSLSNGAGPVLHRSDEAHPAAHRYRTRRLFDRCRCSGWRADIRSASALSGSRCSALSNCSGSGSSSAARILKALEVKSSVRACGQRPWLMHVAARQLCCLDSLWCTRSVRFRSCLSSSPSPSDLVAFGMH